MTLSPGPYTPPLTLGSFFCVGCSGRDSADILANWILFVPGGALTAALVGGKRGVLLAAGLAVLVETLQIGVPGRDPALQDLLADALGALTGVVVVRRGIGRRAQHALAALAALAWLCPVALLVPTTSPADLYGQWTPSFATMETYGGRVLSATAGDVPVPNGLLANQSDVSHALVERRPVALRLRAGPAPPALAPVFQIVDSRRVTLFSLAADGSDLVVFAHTLSTLLRLDQPEVRWRGALTGVEAGDTVRIVVDRSHDSLCMSVDDRTECGLAPSLAEGWGHVAALRGAPAWLRILVSFVWVAGLGVVLGATARSVRSAAARGAALAAAGTALSMLSPDLASKLVFPALLAAASIAAKARWPRGCRRSRRPAG